LGHDLLLHSGDSRVHDGWYYHVWEACMFGFTGGESESTLARKIGFRADAIARWGCLTTLDLSQVKNKEQLIAPVNVRYSLPIPSRGGRRGLDDGQDVLS
jgi:hypothetical protein